MANSLPRTISMGGGTIIGGLVAFSLFKKVAAYGIARYYGFPKIYRKMVRFNRRTAVSLDQAKSLNESIKALFRLPNRVGARVSAYLRRTSVATDNRPSAKNL